MLLKQLNVIFYCSLICLFTYCSANAPSPRIFGPTNNVIHNASIRRSPALSATTAGTPTKPMIVGALFPTSNDNRYYKIDIFQRRFHTSPMGFGGRLKHYKIGILNTTLFIGDNMYPMEIVKILCETFIPFKAGVIVFVSSSEKYGSNTASVQYLYHMISYTGIPIIAWNADNSGLLVNRDLAKYRLVQMAPPIEHQIEAMMHILERYGWSKFAVVTSTVPGNRQFVNILRQYETDQTSKFQVELVKEVTINAKNQSDIDAKLRELSKGDARIILFYSTFIDAQQIFPVAKELGMTGTGYLWIVTQSVIANVKTPSGVFPVGTLGIHFDTSTSYKRETTALVRAIENAVDVLGAALNLMNKDYDGSIDLQSTSTCDSDLNYTWPVGDLFYKYLTKASVETTTGDPQRPKIRIEFNENGKLKDSYLSIVNMKLKGNWEKVGYFAGHQLELYDIVWPGGDPSPPKGMPDKFHMRIVTLDEQPFIIVNERDAQTEKCQQSQSPCRWGSKSVDDGGKNSSVWKCCSGYCVDLLNKLAIDVGFTYELYKVEDGKWGIKEENGQWNGLVADLVNQKADMCVTALKINSDRERDIDFSVPFLETGIAILVALRRGALSPTAFLEPFEYSTWVFILIVSIQAAAIAIFVFEWLSPNSFNMQMKPPENHKFSLFRSYWLVWATLFSASVNTDVPKAHTSRFMALVWAAFALTFLAVYTANLAAFMITRTEFYDLSGIGDPKMINPNDFTPPFKYGTVISGNTQEMLRKNYRKIYKYMGIDNDFFTKNVSDGIKAVKQGKYDAFIYDAVALEYLAGKDENCEILTVGKWFSMTGYGFGYPKNSKWISKINNHMLKYQEKGDLERLQNFWFSGSCSKTRESKLNHSAQLGMENFVSAFALLAVGTVFCLFLLLLEYLYCKYLRNRLARCDRLGLCGLISLSMGRSLTFQEVVRKAHSDYKLAQKLSSDLKTQREQMLESQLSNATREIRELEFKLGRRATLPRAHIVQPSPCAQPVQIQHVTTIFNAQTPAIGQFHSPLSRQKRVSGSSSGSGSYALCPTSYVVPEEPEEEMESVI